MDRLQTVGWGRSINLGDKTQEKNTRQTRRLFHLIQIKPNYQVYCHPTSLGESVSKQIIQYKLVILYTFIYIFDVKMRRYCLGVLVQMTVCPVYFQQIYLDFLSHESRVRKISFSFSLVFYSAFSPIYSSSSVTWQVIMKIRKKTQLRSLP